MSARKSSKTPKPPRAKRKSRVSKFPPEAAAARDEGPRLIPLPDVDSPLPLRGGDPGGLPTNRYVALADLAMRLWDSKPDAPGEAKKAESPSARHPPRR
jgi:hypothetical protein